MSDRSGLVGRGHELAVLAECLADGASGMGALVLLVGEPGVGKTKLATALAERAERAGNAVAWGLCREDGGAPAYHPWTQVLRRVVREFELSPDELERNWPDVANLVSTVPAADGRVAESSDRFRLFVEVALLLAHCASTRPVVVVIDDLHRADEASLALLKFLGPELPTMRAVVLAAYRDGVVDLKHPLGATVSDLADRSRPTTIRLGGLDRDEVADLLERYAGPVSPEVAETVAARTSGNPLFVIELATLLRSIESGKEEAARSGLPNTVQDVVQRQVERLPPETQHALRAAAILGREFGRLPLADLLGVPELSVVAAMQPAAMAGLISPGRDGYRFTHALVQAAVYEALPIERRVELHRRATQAIAALAVVDDERISDLAFHSYHAALDGDVGSARRHTMAAALRARQRLAFEDASRWYSLCVELAERDDAPASELLDLLLEAAANETCAGRTAIGRAHYERAADIARLVGDQLALTRAALGVGSTVVTAGRVDWELVRLLEEAAASATEVSDTARLEGRLAVELYWHEGGEPSRSMSEQALRTAEKSGDPRAIGVALHARQFTLRSPEHLDERIEIGSRLVALTQDVDDPVLAFQATVWLAADVLRTGDLSGFMSLVETLRAAADRSRLPLQDWYATVMQAQLAAVTGKVDRAYTLATTAHELGMRLGHDVASAYRLGQLFVLCREREGLDSLADDIEDVGERLPYFVTVRGFAALAAATTGRADAAAWEIDRLSGDRFGAVPRDSLWVATIALLTEAAAICGSTHTRTLAELLAPHRGNFVVQGVPNCYGSADRFLGRAAIALGDWDDAETFLASALTIESRVAAPMFVARTTLDQARLAACTGRPAAVRRLVAEVRSTANRLGLTALAKEAAQVGGLDKSVLSKREREVLALLSAGASNKDIAADLVLSLNTVERHLANIYAKLGVRGRADAAAFAVRAGLDPR